MSSVIAVDNRLKANQIKSDLRKLLTSIDTQLTG